MDCGLMQYSASRIKPITAIDDYSRVIIGSYRARVKVDKRGVGRSNCTNLQ